MVNLSYWWMLFVGILVPGVTTMLGISAANFWVPIYIVGLGFSPEVGFWLGLLTMFFGYGSATVRNIIQKTVCWEQVLSYGFVVVPAAVAGTALTPFVPVRILLLLFTVFVAVLGAVFLVRMLFFPPTPPAPHRAIRYGRAILGGLLTGLITVGLGKLILGSCTTYQCEHHFENRYAMGLGTVVVVILLASIAAGASRLFLHPELLVSLATEQGKIVSVMAFTAPGVVIGGQVGPYVATKLRAKTLQILFGGVLLLAAIFMFLRFLSMA